MPSSIITANQDEKRRVFGGSEFRRDYDGELAAVSGTPQQSGWLGRGGRNVVREERGGGGG